MGKDDAERVYPICLESTGKIAPLCNEIGDSVGGTRPTTALYGKSMYVRGVSTEPARMNDTLGNTLMIEVSKYFAEDEIFQKPRASRIGPERILIIGQNNALIRGERGVLSSSNLVQLTLRI